MNKKQKKVLKRIILSAILIIAFAVAGNFVSIPKVLEFVLYLIPYLVIGYDILKKAWKGICNKQVFDENFLTPQQRQYRRRPVLRAGGAGQPRL